MLDIWEPHPAAAGTGGGALDVRIGLLRSLVLGVVIGSASQVNSLAQSPVDQFRQIQEEAVASNREHLARPYHFGAQPPGTTFSNHTNHSNRLVPVYVIGRKANLGSVTGANSVYRNSEGLKKLYGRLPEHTLNPEADYADQSDLFRVQADAVNRGVKHLFIVWFDGMDWEPLRASVLARTGKELAPGADSGPQWLGPLGLNDVPIQFGAVVTSSRHTDPPDEKTDLDTQNLRDVESLLGGGYDVRFGGPNPWTPGPLLSRARGYLKGQSATAQERDELKAAGGVLHAYTDSAPSACEFITGRKQTNGVINMTDDGQAIETLFQSLQKRNWAVGTVTSVPFSHASPAAMYAHNVSRDDFQDISRDMLGLPSIIHQLGKHPQLPGLDVVIGAGWGATLALEDSRKQGKNGRPGPLYITAEDLQTIDVDHGGKYVVAQRTPGRNGAQQLQAAAHQAASQKQRLFGLYGTKYGHLPFRTANGDYRPTWGIGGTTQLYTQADLTENPTLAEMTKAALTVLTAQPGRPFALFSEAGDVDFGLHDNNLDNAIGAIVSGEAAIKTIVDWVRAHSNWDESLLIITADHGHYLVIDDPAALAGAARSR